MKNIRKKLPECATTYTDCVIWSGDDIPALGIKTGDCLTATVQAIADKVVELTAPLDLANLSLQCIIDELGQEEPAQRTLSNILQMLIDNDCYLKALIDQIVDSLNSGDAPLVLDLKCLAETDSFGNVLPYNEQTVLQGLINRLCDLITFSEELSGKLDDLQTQIDALGDDTYTEPLLTSCLYTDKPTSQALQILATDYCDYKPVVGDVAMIQTALGMQPANFNTYYQTFPGWNPIVNSLAQLNQNMMIVLGDFHTRLTNIENNCCALDCDDIELGFGAVIENDNLILTFNNIYGTDIPSAFTDCGSTYIVEDANGNKIGGNLIITNNYVADDISLSGLEKGTLLTITITTKLCTDDGQTCQKCLTKTMLYEGGCCIITNSGSEEMTIVYSAPLVTL